MRYFFVKTGITSLNRNVADFRQHGASEKQEQCCSFLGLS